MAMDSRGYGYGDREKQDKQNLEYAERAQTQASPAMNIGGMVGSCSDRRPALHEEMEKTAADHLQEAQRLEKGAEFLRSHPEFGEFINLIRTGYIRI